MPTPIIVINPNSTEAVTDGMSEAVDSLRRPDGPAIECVTPAWRAAGGWRRRWTWRASSLPICDYVRRRNDEAGAFVIGLLQRPPGCTRRERWRGHRCSGSRRARWATALTRGDRFGVISILAGSIPRHVRQVPGHGTRRPVRGRPAGGPGRHRAWRRRRGLRAHGSRRKAPPRRVWRGRGESSAVRAWPGFSAPLEDALGLPVVEPTRAAVTLALGGGDRLSARCSGGRSDLDPHPRSARRYRP